MTRTSGSPASLAELIESFGADPMRSRADIEALRRESPESFAHSSLTVILEGRPSQGHRYLLSRLLFTGIFVEILGGASRLQPGQAADFLRSAIRIDSQFDVKLTRWLLDPVNRKHVEDLGARSEILLDVLAEVSPGNRLLPLVVQFLRSRGERVSSKAALFVAQRSQRVELALTDSDARVRANAIEALWGVDTMKARLALWNALEDANHRVIGNAIVGLLKLRERSVLSRLRSMAQHTDPLFRATAAWAMGQSGDRSFYQVLAHLKEEGPPEVSAAAERSLALFDARQVVVRQRPKIPVHMLRLISSPGGRMRITLRIGPPHDTDEDLIASVSRNGEEIEGVQMRHVPIGPQAVGLLLPAVWSDQIHAATREILNTRRSIDRFALATYSTIRPSVEGPIGDYQPLRGLTLAGRPGSGPRIVFSLEPQIPPRLQQETDKIRTLPVALTSILSAPAGLSAHGGVILFAVPSPAFDGEVPQEIVDHILQEADFSGGTINVVACPGLSPNGLQLLQRLCAETGGLMVPASLAAMLYTSLSDPLEVTFRCPSEPGDKLLLRIDNGEAEGLVPLDTRETSWHTRHEENVWFPEPVTEDRTD